MRLHGALFTLISPPFRAYSVSPAAWTFVAGCYCVLPSHLPVWKCTWVFLWGIAHFVFPAGWAPLPLPPTLTEVPLLDWLRGQICDPHLADGRFLSPGDTDRPMIQVTPKVFSPKVFLEILGNKTKRYCLSVEVVGPTGGGSAIFSSFFASARGEPT